MSEPNKAATELSSPEHSTNKDDLIQELDHLTRVLHDAEKSRTLEEQVAYLKSQGINPSQTYAKWDDDDSEHDSNP